MPAGTMRPIVPFVHPNYSGGVWGGGHPYPRRQDMRRVERLDGKEEVGFSEHRPTLGLIAWVSPLEGLPRPGCRDTRELGHLSGELRPVSDASDLPGAFVSEPWCFAFAQLSLFFLFTSSKPSNRFRYRP